MTTHTRERNRRGSGGRLRDEIIDAGIDLIDTANDATALTLRGIARAARIAAPSIYTHFADLPAVTEAVLERSFSELEASVSAAVTAEAAPRTALLAGCGAYVRFGWTHPARYRLMFAATGFAPNAVGTYTLIENTIVRCIDSGLSTSTDPHLDTFLVWVAMHGIATLEKPDRADYLRLGPLDRPAIVGTLVQRLARLTDDAPGQ